jgi:two-component system chemotaxis response regulator CheB
MNKKTNMNIIVIGSSTGGPKLLNKIFAELPILNATIIIVQHVPPVFDKAIAERLDSISPMSVVLANDGDTLKESTVYVAQAKLHLLLSENYKINLVKDKKINCCIPSIDATMTSLCNNKDGKIIGVLLTGMGKDGAAGISHIKHIGGITIAQDKESSTIYGMPKAAYETGNVDYVLHEDKLSAMLIKLVGRK